MNGIFNDISYQVPAMADFEIRSGRLGGLPAQCLPELLHRCAGIRRRDRENDRLTDTSGEVATSEFPRRAQLSRIPLTTDLVSSMRVRPMSRCTSLPSP